MKFNFYFLILVFLFLITIFVPLVSSQIVPRDKWCVFWFEGRIHRCTDPVLKISYPFEHGPVTNVITISAGIVSSKFDPNRALQVAFEYSYDGKVWHLIEDQTGNVFARQWESHWDLAGVQPGPALIRVMLVDVDETLWQDIIQVNVNLAPQNDMQINRDRSNLILDGTQSFDQDGKILGYDWLIDTDDEQFTVQGDRVFIPVEQLPIGEQFGIGLTTIDDQKGTTATHTLVQVPCPDCQPQQQPKTCGCQSMDIKNSGQAEFPMWWMPPDNNSSLGPYDDVNMTKAGPFDFRHNFQVEATLKPKSDPTECFEGQRVKLSYKILGTDYNYSGAESTVDVNGKFSKGANVPCPFSGAKWCDDNYNAPQAGYKIHKGQDKIIWEDGPGYGKRSGSKGILKAWISGGGIEHKYKFEARVTGPAGACQCNWDIVRSIDQNGNVTKNILENKVCS